ncbi:hypothetical protein LSH36_21g08004 [Paralvinella palmiformis]|uniref:Uncharacterized protein n=1 Tax=Paralvinella palmiformis TaxID=53620 RepID=A0AAD9NF69_9ANNE|nr:hypothetical protein LSH36_21g08004 [Paralvinella palmiformis]
MLSVYLQEPSVEPEVVELATEPTVEIVSLEPSNGNKEKEKKVVKVSAKNGSAKSQKRSFEYFFSVTRGTGRRRGFPPLERILLPNSNPISSPVCQFVDPAIVS